MIGVLWLLLLLGVAVQGDNNMIKVDNLENVLKVERQILNNLRNYAKELELKLQHINGAIIEYSKRIRVADRNPDLYLTNPIYAFSLMSHMRRDWPTWLEYMMQTVGKEQIELQQRLVTLTPDLSTYKQSAESLQTLFRFYNYEPLGFVKNESLEHLRLTPKDCYYMGEELVKQQKYHEALEWLNVAAKYYTTSPENDLIGVPHWRVYEMQFKAFNKLNMMEKAVNALRAAIDLNPENEKLLNRLDELNTEDPLPAPRRTLSNLEQLCQGNFVPNSELTCELSSVEGPFQHLAPLRMEELSYEPYILLYKDGIYDSEIRHMEQAFKLCPSNASVETLDNVKGCSVPDTYSRVTLGLTDRVADMAGLDRHYMNWFLFEYGPKEPFSLPDLQKLQLHYDDIEAIVILFLNDVELGGGITIPNYEMMAFPQRGDALIVYNEAEFPITMCPNVFEKRRIAIKYLFADI